MYNGPSETGRYPFVHCNVLFLCTFFNIWLCLLILFSFCTFFTLHSFDFAFVCVSIFSCSTLLKLHYYRVALFYVVFFMLHFSCLALFSCCTSAHFLYCTISMLLFFCIAIFLPGTFFVLHSFHVAYFFVLNSFRFSLFLYRTIFMLHLFQSAVFSHCSFFTLHYFHPALFSLNFQFWTFQILLFSWCISSNNNTCIT